jgi:hypothetical protein
MMAHRVGIERLENRELLDGNAISLAYDRIPLSFEANEGQTDSQVDFLARGNGYALFLTPTQAVLSLPKDVLRMQLVGGRTAPVVGLDKQASTSNYFVGSDPSHWRTNLANYGRVEYFGIYPGIDLVYYGNQRQLEYDFVVGPGANPGIIQLSFQGTQNLTLDAQGNLVLHTADGDVVEHAPVVYQDAPGGRQTILGRYVLEGPSQVGFQVGPYDTSRPLVIDPVLSYSTYLDGGGSGDFGDAGRAIAVDASGNVYVTGSTASYVFPTTPGAVQTSNANGTDAFVTKLNATGTALLYSTFLGGSGTDIGNGIAVDASGNAYVTGYTNSSNSGLQRGFPTTARAVQTALAGSQNAFVAKLNATGTALLYSTYLGGSGTDQGNGIAVDGSGNAYVTGQTTSPNFPTKPGVVQTTYGNGSGDAFVAKLNPMGTALVYSTYLGGTGDDFGNGIVVDASGNAYVAGGTSSSNFPTTPGAVQTTRSNSSGNAFVAKFNATGSALIYSTYLGGSVDDVAHGIAVDASGNAYVTGNTTSPNFPMTPGAFRTISGGNNDTFVAKLNATGTALVYSTYLGGSGQDSGNGIAVDASGNAYVTGSTGSSDFPTTSGAIQTSMDGGALEAFVVKLDAAGTALLYSTYLGGSGMDAGNAVAVDASANAYVTGTTNSSDFPTTPGTVQPTFSGGTSDVFVAKVDFAHSATTSAVSSSLNTSTYGQSVAFTVTVTSGGSPVTSGTVTFQDGNIILASAVALNGNGQAAFSVSSLTAGTHTITVSYSGTATLLSSSGSVVQTVNPAPLTISADNESMVYGSPFPTLTASYSGFVNGNTAASLTTPATLTTTATAGSPVGSYPIQPSGAVDANYTITYVAGTFTITPLAVISGTVFHDYNTNGVQDPGEPGLAGQTLFLDLDGSGQLKPGDPTATTDANGDYQLTGLNAGTYTVREVLLGGVLLSAPASGSDSVTLTSGQSVTGQNFASVLTSIGVPLTLPLNTSFPAQGNANADYVEALYRAVLDRDADAGGLANWTSLLNNGTQTRLQIVQGIRNSVEHFTQEVTDFYFTLLGRAPDSAGLQNWVQQLESGMREEQMAFYFLDSPEYLSQGDKHFVDAMYQSLLGRSFDAPGEANWLNQLGDDASGNPTRPATLTHEQMITNFLYSQESLTRLTEGYYEVFLQRAADTGGLNAWVGQLQQGLSFLTIGQQFLSSDEFYNRAAQQG